MRVSAWFTTPGLGAGVGVGVKNCLPKTKLGISICHHRDSHFQTEFMRKELAMHYSFAVRAIAVGIAAASSTCAYAETVNTIADLPNNKRTVAYMYASTMQEWLYRLGVEQDRKFGIQQECKSQYRVEPYSVSVLQPIDFPDDKQHPVKGIWNFRYQLQRCGESKFYNTIFIASANGETPPTPRAYYPGATNASPVLVKDAMLGALTSAMVKADQKDCKDIDVFDMRVTEPAHDVTDGEKTLKGVWNEAWTFRLCRQMVDVGISFIPDTTGGGTRYVVNPVKTSETAKKQ